MSNFVCVCESVHAYEHTLFTFRAASMWTEINEGFLFFFFIFIKLITFLKKSCYIFRFCHDIVAMFSYFLFQLSNQWFGFIILYYNFPNSCYCRCYCLYILFICDHNLFCYFILKKFQLNIEPNHTTLAGHAYEHDIVMASA